MERLVGTYIFDPEMTAGKMIFLTGPRQVGKTTFAQMWLKSARSEDTYFNWDDPGVMIEYKRNPLYFRNIVDEKYHKKPVPLVFDEIHKHKEWRNILKGFHDTNRDRINLLVTGSARLDFLRKSGDSLVGRYFSFRMFPLGLPEVVGNFTHVVNDNIFADGNMLVQHARNVRVKGTGEGLEALLRFGGFPEPFVKGTEKFHRRWQREYKTLIAKEEVRELSQIQDIKGLETLVEILPTRVGSNISMLSLANDLGRKYDTIKKWIDVLQGLYLVFTVRPWHKNIVRAIQKETKLYFYDWSTILESVIKFENLLSVSLSRMTERFTEIGLGSFEIRYIRDREKREVDFVMVKDNRPVCLFEAKESDTGISKPGRFFSERLKVPLYQIVRNAKKIEAFHGNCFVIPAENLLMLTG